jgi:hypothetical protein
MEKYGERIMLTGAPETQKRSFNAGTLAPPPLPRNGSSGVGSSLVAD